MMKLLLKISMVSLFAILLQNSCIAQDGQKRKAFISVNSGVYFPSMENFNKVYNSPAAFINGLSLGIPISNENLFLYGKAMYFQKVGVPIAHHFVYENGVMRVSTTQEGNVKLKELLINLGVQYNAEFKQTNVIVINAGILVVKASEKIKSDSSNSESKANGFAGYFLGVGYEKKLSDRLGAFSEVQYNVDRIIFKLFDISYGGANVNVGIRYYL